MSKIALYSAIAGTGSVGVVVVAVATGTLDLPKPDPVAEPAPAALIAPDVAAVSPQAAPQPDTGDAASLVADPASAPVPTVEPEAEEEAIVVDEPAADDASDPIGGVKSEADAVLSQEDPVETAVEPTFAAPIVEEQVAALAQPEQEPDADAPPVPKPIPQTAAIEPAEPTQEAQPAPEPDPSTAAEDAAPAAVPQTAEGDEPGSKTPAPTFDIVRTETDGSTLIAGVAVPGSQVDVMLDGKAEVSATVGSDGRFVAFVDVPTNGAASVLTLRNETAKGLSLSEQEVIITPAIPAAPEKQPQKEAVVAMADPENSPAPVAESGDAIATQTPISETPEVEASELAAPQTATLEAVSSADIVPDEAAPQIAALDPPAPIAPKSAETAFAVASGPDVAPQGAVREEPEAAQEPAKLVPPTILLSSARGVEVLQTAPLSPGDVALDSISYDEQGDVLLAGRGEEAGSVRIYLDNTPITTSRIREDGRWRVELPQVDTGTYTLRVDQIDASGAVIARVESLFLRESAEVLTRAAAASGGGIARSITVQPGHTLWEISNNRYGDGKEYVRVFEANRDRIGDPDLIYPGQIFDLPN